MSEIQSSIVDLALSVKARFAKPRVMKAPVLDPYAGEPLRREELEDLFAMNEAQEDDVAPEALRESERLERESMAMIRNALYED